MLFSIYYLSSMCISRFRFLEIKWPLKISPRDKKSWEGEEQNTTHHHINQSTNSGWGAGEWMNESINSPSIHQSITYTRTKNRAPAAITLLQFVEVEYHNYFHLHEVSNGIGAKPVPPASPSGPSIGFCWKMFIFHFLATIILSSKRQVLSNFQPPQSFVPRK